MIDREPKSRPHTVGAVQSAFRILRFLASCQEPVRLVTITRALDLNTSTCLNILRTLSDEGMIRSQREAKTYSLDLGLAELGQAALRLGGDVQHIQPEMQRLADRFRVTIMLWQRIGATMVAILTATPSEGNHVFGATGARLPLLTGSMGRTFAMAGGLPFGAIEDLFSEVQWQTPLIFDEFLKQARDGQKRGWWLDRGYAFKGMWGLAVPLPSGSQPADRILNAAMTADQFDDAGLNELAEQLKLVAASGGLGLPCS